MQELDGMSESLKKTLRNDCLSLRKINTSTCTGVVLSRFYKPIIVKYWSCFSVSFCWINRDWNSVVISVCLSVLPSNVLEEFSLEARLPLARAAQRWRETSLSVLREKRFQRRVELLWSQECLQEDVWEIEERCDRRERKWLKNYCRCRCKKLTVLRMEDVHVQIHIHLHFM